ncbi:hypothetical protein D3C72_1516870 [compost metagenome]
MRFGCQLELAITREITGDSLLLNYRDNALHRILVGTVIGARSLTAETGSQPGVVLSNSSTAMTTVAPGGFADHPPGLQDRHTSPFQG